MRFMIALSLVYFGLALAHADESTGEKAQATTNHVKRSIKRGAHRAEEKVCMKSDAECLAEKAKHRASEAGEYTKDKANETLDKVDSDSKAR